MIRSATDTAPLPRPAGLLDEELMPLNEVAGMFPRRRGRKIHKVTLWRYATKGAKAADGGRARLETIKFGATRYTSREAIGRFVAALTGPTAAEAVAPVASALRSDSRRRRDLAAATAVLAAGGFFDD